MNIYWIRNDFFGVVGALVTILTGIAMVGMFFDGEWMNANSAAMICLTSYTFTSWVGEDDVELAVLGFIIWMPCLLWLRFCTA